MIKFIVVLLVVLSTSASAKEVEENDSAVSMLVISKMTGLCGAISQMARFQESTKMNGGDEFLSRFVGTEVARLGFTSEQFIAFCKKSTETYQTYMDMSGYKG